MELKIEVDESMFKDIAEQGLKSLTPDQLTDICIQAIGKYFETNSNAIENLLVDRGRYGYDCNPSGFTKNILEACDFSKLQEVVDMAIAKLKENYESMLNHCLLELMVSGICKESAFRHGLEEALYEIQRKNRE